MCTQSLLGPLPYRQAILLEAAVQKGDALRVKTLLRKNENADKINMRNGEGFRLLDQVKWGNIATTLVLLWHGARPGAYPNGKDANHLTQRLYRVLYWSIQLPASLVFHFFVAIFSTFISVAEKNAIARAHRMGYGGQLALAPHADCHDGTDSVARNVVIVQNRMVRNNFVCYAENFRSMD